MSLNRLIVVVALLTLSLPGVAYAQSCAGACGGDGGGCWCDDSCMEFGDCCADVCTWCPGTEGCGGGGNASCAGACGGDGGGCWCDEGCFDFGDCCGDVCNFCGSLDGCGGGQPQNTCAGNCGGDGGDCWCDEACFNNNDCCSDVCNFCDLDGCGGGGGNKCPGYSGSSACCETDDPCGWSSDNICDCDGTCSWDEGDCGGGPQPGGGDCCAANGSPGCDNSAIQNCVCAQDSFCCDNEWDDICVGEVEEFGCGDCGGGGPGPGSGDCCEDNGSPGCADAAIQNCVCAQDAYCCDTQWDGMCVDEVEQFGCGQCEGGGGDQCPGYTGSSACCMSDDPCGWASDGICDCDSTCGWDQEDCNGGPGPGGGDCCTAHEGAGCDDASIQNCVCAQDSFCCESQWDDICVGEVEEFGCGDCGGGGPGPGSGDCCEANGSPGCNDASIQNCVCGQDAFCCENDWDNICVDEVEEFGCGECGGAGEDTCPGYTGSSACCMTDDPCGWAADGICDCDSTCGWDEPDCGGGPGPGTGDCCEAQEGPGCDDAGIQNCVCAQDDYCCQTAWDDICVGEVDEFGCGQCGGGPGPETGDCCEDNGTPGCDDAGIQNCVCAQDAYCCETQWDGICVGEVDEFGCGQCDGGGEGQTCPGYSGSSACCKTDDPCEWEADGICDCDGTCGWNEADCGGGPGPGEGDCCAANGTPGCADAAIQGCVCAEDSYCCETEWDDICAGEVEDLGCGSCGGGPGPGGDCCTPSETPGCSDGAIENCVCAQDSFCCETQWDQLCVDEVAEFGCGDCGGGPGPGSGDCCEEQDGPGCENQIVQDCVCAQDSFCCENTWDSICVDEVDQFGCGDCGGGGGDNCPGYTGSSACCKTDDPCDWGADGICDCEGTCDWDTPDCGGGPGPGGDCCEAQDGPGCDDAAIQNCVCDQDDYCCATAWDDICVGEVEEFGCGDCGGGPGPGGDCCQPQDGPGCSDAAIQNCVCDQDDYCCATVWDDICVGEVEEFGCGDCGGGPGPGPGSCCEPQEGPGCDNPTVQACVCAVDSFCCEFTWDSICVDEVESEGCGDCSGGGCGDGQCGVDEDCLTCEEDCGPCQGSNCCEPHPEPGCDDPAIQGCVCDQDAYCCDVEWDGICADEVTSLGCGSCDGGGPTCPNGQCEGGETCNTCPEDCGECPPAGGDCCEPHETPGCDDPAIQACVCALDGFCCDVQWDEICVGEVSSGDCGECGGGCIPDCEGKACGNDGCGGTCGSCANGESCHNGKCIEDGCQPQCNGKKCGNDGCGGTCGNCPPGTSCINGQCGGCQPKCGGKQCGDDGCGGSCGTCPPGHFCNDGHCGQQCKPDCTGKQCGGDGCGGTCGSCPPGFYCNPGGLCEEKCVPACAGKQCGSDGCGGSCGTCPDGYMCNAQGHCSSSCVANCAAKQCGDDGCGGSCGSCKEGDYCNLQGHCLDGCTPDCTGKECGSDGCGGSCGNCSFSQICNAVFNCEDVCQPNCLNKECGADGCGGQCGACGGDSTCSELGLCIVCNPDCGGKVCGDDGCGGECGVCPQPLVCYDKAGTCVAEEELPEETDDVWNGQWDGWGEVGGNGGTLCGEGERLLYGKCVPMEGEGPPDKDSGCSASASTGSGANSTWLLALLLGMALLYARRRRVKGHNLG